MSATAKAIKSPFPYPGGKSRVADLVWNRFGDVSNFVEPFAGSLAVLLRRPPIHLVDNRKREAINDKNHYLVNFWRATAADPDAVAKWADWPVTEADLHARHRWLVQSREADEFREAMRTDPTHFNAKIAGWWVWGQCCWIGGQWCRDGVAHKRQMPQLDVDHGVNVGPVEASSLWAQMPDLDSGSAGRGENSTPGGRPQLADKFQIGRGVNAGPGNCDARREWLTAWMRQLSDRLRNVRTCYGHWSRVCDSDSTLTRLGLTGVFLDPPYPSRRADTGEKSRDATLYATDGTDSDLDRLRDEVLDWCRRWGDNQKIRVAVCGYEGDGYEALESSGWSVESWEANGGYANQRRGGKGKSANAKRERIWFNPACNRAERSLFDE